MRRSMMLSLVLAMVSVRILPAAETVIDADTILDTLEAAHPRLMLKEADLELLKELYPKDEFLQACVKDVLERADRILEEKQLTYDKRGPRLLHVSRSCLGRIYALCLAYRWTGDERYAGKAVENLLTVCDFKNWNPSHFLDVAEMSHAVGIGYDWLYRYMDDKTRERIASGLVKHGMKPGIEAYSKGAWWTKSDFNWNQVCNSGLMIGALAIAESSPEYARVIVPNAIRSLPKAIQSYAPDGAWGEGPGYWNYATDYTAYGIAALDSALGKDYGLSEIAGLSKAGYAPIYTAGPTGFYLNYADSGEKSRRTKMACMSWLGRKFNNTFFSEDEHRVIALKGADPQHVMWYLPPGDDGEESKDLDRYFGGNVEVVTLRSSWDDPNALFVGVKAGYNQVNHGHLDLGNFEFDALGVRWARDLGSEDYNLPGYWEGKKGGRRWTYYRLRSLSHNVPILGGKDQDPDAKAKIVKFRSQGSSSFAVVDLNEAYKEFADRTMRGVALVDGRQALLVQDEFRIRAPCEVAWGMTTDADIKIGKGGTATLEMDGKTLLVEILSPEGATFAEESAEQKPPEKVNAKVKRLIISLKAVQGDVRIAVLLRPAPPNTEYMKNISIEPLTDW